MSLNQFWYGDMRLLEVYNIAYMRSTTHLAWMNGNYNRIATEIGARNALITKKQDHIDKWVDYTDPIERMVGASLTNSDKEKIFRQKQIADQNWLFGK